MSLLFKGIALGFTAMGALLVPLSIKAADVHIPWLNGASIGMGYDAARGDLVRRTCISSTALPETRILGTGLHDGIHLERIDSKEQLISTLVASASGQAKFAVMSASARMSFARSVSISRNDTTMLIRHVISTVEIGSTVGDILPGYNSPKVKAPQFRRECGTHFVSTIIYGGELIMALQATERDEARKEQFEANVRAASSAMSGSGDVRTTKEQLSKHSYLRIQGRKAGGGDTAAYNLDTFASEVQGFRAQVEKNPKAAVLYIVVSPYPHMPLDASSAQVDAASNKLIALNSKLDTLNDITSDPTQYDINVRDHPLLVSARDQIQRVRDALRLDIEECIYPTTRPSSKSSCGKLAGYVTPPSSVLDTDLPLKFEASCVSPPIQLPKTQFYGISNFRQGDGRIGQWMKVRFIVEPIVSDGRILRYSITKEVSEPGSSKLGAEEEIHELRKEIDAWSSPGCLILSTPSRLETPTITFRGKQTHSFGQFIDQATCEPATVPAANIPIRGQSSTYNCDVTFLPVRNLQIANHELFENGKLRERKPFKGLTWLGASAAAR
ncbi:hypothetical protein FQV39_04605 [Bosea sp. F3-2]|uniref:hypothetical protein n=1 Tax=Bosea sp. F3-2 TaxID=2599640 RepID=UPI0011ED665C|nr:hypothetical protein [Bosea sp. F3-2]QEL21937.1 hypothetical protein FQV39_04605 [Bosea sp. F3-2]